MPIQVKCPNGACGKTFAVKDEFAGRRAKCPGCGGVLTIPGGAEVPVMAAAAPPPPPPPPMARQSAPPPPARMDEEDDYDAPPRRREAPPGGDMFAAVGLEGLNKILFWVGVGFLFFCVILVVLPWSSIEVPILGKSTGTG